MHERITGTLKLTYNVNVKFNASSSPACSVAERKFKQLLKKLSEIDSFPPPDIVDLHMDVLAQPDDRTGTSRGKQKSPRHDDDELQVKEKKKRGRKKGSSYPSDKSKKADGEQSSLKRRKSDDSAEGTLKKKRKRRSSNDDEQGKSREEKSKQPIGDGEKRKRDRKAEKERRDAAKLAEFGGSIAEVKLTDEQRRERDALACVAVFVTSATLFYSIFRYKPKVPLEKLSEEMRLRHEELSQALRQVPPSLSPFSYCAIVLIFVSAICLSKPRRQ
jgi:hypothetical protein